MAKRVRSWEQLSLLGGEHVGVTLSLDMWCSADNAANLVATVTVRDCRSNPVAVIETRVGTFGTPGLAEDLCGLVREMLSAAEGLVSPF